MYTAPYFHNSQKRFFFFENFDLLKVFLKLLLSTCLHFKLVYILKLFKICIKIFYGKVDLFTPSLGDKDVVILYRFDFDLEKKKNLGSPKKSACLHPLKEKLWRTTKQLLSFGGGRGLHFYPSLCWCTQQVNNKKSNFRCLMQIQQKH